jgi:hypothetical protein
MEEHVDVTARDPEQGRDVERVAAETAGRVKARRHVSAARHGGGGRHRDPVQGMPLQQSVDDEQTWP